MWRLIDTLTRKIVSIPFAISGEQFADILTHGVPSKVLQDSIIKLGIISLGSNLDPLSDFKRDFVPLADFKRDFVLPLLDLCHIDDLSICDKSYAT
ncbi:hypothetical protein DVH24_012224 [Malus domestica]|uniref:Uncharacterized protein n=1 Tax=Malus domestica TaxID=3750 RepID=A0A498HP83_MALDO|nr:hypothetical protein DVH24_012224 [Malus domestica]